MKTSKRIALTAVFLLALATISYAGYVKGYKVVGVVDGQVTIQKGQAEPVQIQVGNKKFVIGDKVDYDAQKGKLRKEALETTC